MDKLQCREKELLAAKHSDMAEADKAHKEILGQAKQEWAAELEKLKAQYQKEVTTKGEELDKEYQVRSDIVAAKLRQITVKARELDSRAAGKFLGLLFLCLAVGCSAAGLLLSFLIFCFFALRAE